MKRLAVSIVALLAIASLTHAAPAPADLPTVAQLQDQLKAGQVQEVSRSVTKLLCGELEQVVAGGVSAGVVDVLELVEVDEEEGAARAGIRAPRKLRLELRDEAMAVRETRELVVIGKVQ